MRCSNCGKVSNASQLKGGYCLSCKPELKKEEITNNQNTQNQTNPKKNDDIFSGLGQAAIVGLIAGIAALIFLKNVS